MSKLKKRLSSISKKKEMNQDFILLELNKSVLNMAYGGAKTNEKCQNHMCGILLHGDTNNTCTNTRCFDGDTNNTCTNSQC